MLFESDLRMFFSAPSCCRAFHNQFDDFLFEQLSPSQPASRPSQAISLLRAPSKTARAEFGLYLRVSTASTLSNNCATLELTS